MTTSLPSAAKAADFPVLRTLAEILGAVAPLEVEEAGDTDNATVFACPTCDGQGSLAADEVLTMHASPHDFPIGAIGIQCFGIGDGHGNLERALRDAPKEIAALLAKLAEVEVEATTNRLALALWMNGSTANQPLIDDIERWRQEIAARVYQDEAVKSALTRADSAEALLRECDDELRLQDIRPALRERISAHLANRGTP